MSELNLNSVCIVGYGCVLPKASNIEEFWRRILEGKNLVETIHSDRWNDELTDPNAGAEVESPVSSLSAQISKEAVEKIRERHDLPKAANRLTCYAVEAVAQARAMTKGPPRRTAAIFGMMNPDKSYYAQHVASEIKWLRRTVLENVPGLTADDERALDELTLRHLVKTSYQDHDEDSDVNVVMSLAFKELTKRFQINGPAFFTDAACASSLAAIDVAVALLRAGEVDLIYTGGLESNLDLGAFVLFSKVKALSTSACLPFDKRSMGINQAEGAVVFAMKRLETALLDGDEIYGVIKSCNGSSDGRSASLFQPTVTGQLVVYQKVHGNQKPQLDYIEAHATGTPVGDSTEAQSLRTFFGDDVYVGSAKSVFGHTKGAAGATSLLKALMVMKHRTAPPSPYVEATYFDDLASTKLRINRNSEPIKKEGPLRVAVSSLGFGGSNYHLVVEQANPSAIEKIKAELYTNASVPSPHESSANKVVVIGEAAASNGEKFDTSFYKVPPNSLKQIDPMQMLGVYAVERLIGSLKNGLNGIPKDRISVISYGTNGLEQLSLLAKRIFYYHVAEKTDDADQLPPRVQQVLSYVREKILPTMPKITEDSGPGILNNVIAGRISNAFNFMGKNFSVDAELLSKDAGFYCAFHLLQQDPQQLVFVCGLDETYDSKTFKFVRTGVRVSALTSHEFALEYALPIHTQFESATYQAVEASGPLS